MRLIIVIILLLLIYVLNKQNFIGGSINNKYMKNEDISNNKHQNKKLYSEIKTQKKTEEATKKINNFTNSIDDIGDKFNKTYIETKNTNRKSFLAYYLSKKLDELEVLMDKVVNPLKDH